MIINLMKTQHQPLFKELCSIIISVYGNQPNDCRLRRNLALSLLKNIMANEEIKGHGCFILLLTDRAVLDANALVKFS